MMSIGIPMDKKIFVKDEKNPARGGIRNDKAAHRRLNQVLEIFNLPVLHSSAGAALFCVFGFSVGDGLPLHVAVVIGAAGAERGGVIDDEARARVVRLRRSGGGAGGDADELSAGCGAAGWRRLRLPGAGYGCCRRGEASPETIHDVEAITAATQRPAKDIAAACWIACFCSSLRVIVTASSSVFAPWP